MFFRKKVFKSEAELQQYVDKKINSTITSLINNVNQTVEIQKLNERIIHLEKYLGIEFGTECVTGYSKVKKKNK